MLTTRMSCFIVIIMVLSFISYQVSAQAHSCIDEHFVQKVTRNSPLNYIAWNEDTVKSFYMFVFKNDQFVYEIADSMKGLHSFYYGAVKNVGDTMYLHFYNKCKPLQWPANYLIKEASGGYIIMPSVSDSPGMYLRIKRLGSRVI